MKKLLLLLWILVGAIIILIYRNTHFNPKPILIGFVGDVMIGRMVNELLQKQPGHNVWGTMLPIMKQQKMVICNLETALTTYDKPVPKVFNYKSDPVHVHVLKQANIGLVNLANNHVLDYGLPGFENTLQTLRNAGITVVGAGINDQQAQHPAIFNFENTRFAILGATDNEPTWAAGTDKPGTNYIEVGDSRLLNEIKVCRELADVVIVTLHWGPNMREYPSQNFIDYAHAMIDAGADIIAGHSAHVVQGIEVYRDRLILYDMGDFIDDYAIDEELRNDLTALFSVTIENDRVTKLSIIPARISDMTVNRAEGDEAQQIMDLILRRSKQFGTRFEQLDSYLQVML